MYMPVGVCIVYVDTYVRNRRMCPSLCMHNDYMPIRGVQGRIHIYNTDI